MSNAKLFITIPISLHKKLKEKQLKETVKQKTVISLQEVIRQILTKELSK